MRLYSFFTFLLALAYQFSNILKIKCDINQQGFKIVQGGGPRIVVSTAALHARARGSVPGLGGLKETKNVSSPST